MTGKLELRIVNRTDFDGRLLRQAARLALLHEGMSGPYLVEFYYRRTAPWGNDDGAVRNGDGIRGWGYYHRQHMKIGLPGSTRAVAHGPLLRCPEVSAERVAAVVIHEAAHNRGLKHGDMSAAVNACEVVPEGLAGVMIGRKKPAKKARTPASEKHAATVERLEATIAEAEAAHERRMKGLRTRLKRARGLLRRAARGAD